MTARCLALLPLLAACSKETRIEELGIDAAISTINVKSGAGAIDVVPSEDGTTSVVVTLLGKGTEFSYEVKDGELTLKKKCGFMNMGPCEVDFEISAPENVVLDLVSDEGQISVTGWVGAVTAETSSGGVVIDGCEGNLIIDSRSGDISGAEIASAHLGVLGGSGEVQLDVVNSDVADVTIDSGSGDVTLYLPSQGSYNYTAESNSGQVIINNVTFNTNSAQVVEVTTGSGDINILGQ